MSPAFCTNCTHKGWSLLSQSSLPCSISVQSSTKQWQFRGMGGGGRMSPEVEDPLAPYPADRLSKVLLWEQSRGMTISLLLQPCSGKALWCRGCEASKTPLLPCPGAHTRARAHTHAHAGAGTSFKQEGPCFWYQGSGMQTAAQCCLSMRRLYSLKHWALSKENLHISSSPF